MRLFVKILILTITSLSATVLSSCNLVNDDYLQESIDDIKGVDTVTLSFRMISSDVRKSRADNQHSEQDSDYPAFEDYIGADNMAMYLFAETSRADGGTLVMKVTDFTGSGAVDNTVIFESFGCYTVTTTIKKSLLFDSLNLNEEDNSSTIQFRLVALANLNGLVGVDDNVYEELPTASYNQFITALGQLKVDVEAISVPTDALDTDFPNNGLPMFGMLDFNLSIRQLEASAPGQRIMIDDLYMLRTVAKVRIIDNISGIAGTSARIESVRVRGSKYSYVLPAIHDYSNGNQIHTPNPVADSDEAEVTLTSLSWQPKVYFGYISEQYNLAEKSPEIIITVSYDPGDGGNRVHEDFLVNMTGYNQTNFSFGNSIFRNHIYTLSVDNISGGLVLSACVKPYTVVDLEPVFGLDDDEEEDENKTPETQALKQ